MLHEARLLLEKHKLSAGLVSAIRKSKIWNSIRTYRTNRRAKRREYLRTHDYDRFSLMREKETRKEFSACYVSHKSMFETVASILEDEVSRETLQTVIDYRLAPNREKLRTIVVSPMYFQKDLLMPAKDEVFVNGGAYTGDTIIGLEEFSGGGAGKKYMLGNPTRLTEAV